MLDIRTGLLALAMATAAVPAQAIVVFDDPTDSAALGLLRAGEGEAFAGFAAAGEIFTHSFTFMIPAEGTLSFTLAVPRNAPFWNTQDLFFNLTGFTSAGVDINFGATFVDGDAETLVISAPFGFTSFRIDIEGLATGSLGANYAANIAVTPLPAGVALLGAALAGLGLAARRRA